MASHQKEVEWDEFIRRRLWADFEEICPTPKKCSKPMMPSGCTECGWNADQHYAEAEAAADKLEARDGQESEDG